MKTFTVLYREHQTFFEEPFAFVCEADNSDHAEEQCLDAEPDANILWIVETDDVETAKQNYYNDWIGE